MQQFSFTPLQGASTSGFSTCSRFRTSESPSPSQKPASQQQCTPRRQPSIFDKPQVNKTATARSGEVENAREPVGQDLLRKFEDLEIESSSVCTWMAESPALKGHSLFEGLNPVQSIGTNSSVSLFKDLK